MRLKNYEAGIIGLLNIYDVSWRAGSRHLVNTSKPFWIFSSGLFITGVDQKAGILLIYGHPNGLWCE